MGAVMRMLSSTTDSSDRATSSNGDPRNRWLQRARTSAPIAGMVAPLSVDTASRLHAGAASHTAARNPARLAALAIVSGASTRPCPCRSMRRLNSGPASEYASAYAAAADPARPYEPVAAETKKTTLSTVIRCAIRAANPATSNATVPGAEKSWPYRLVMNLRIPPRPSGGAVAGRPAQPTLRSHMNVRVKRRPCRMRIGELSRRTGVSARLLRYYEEQGLLTPSRR